MDCIDHGRITKRKMGYAVCSHEGTLTSRHRVAYCKAHGLSLSDIKGKVVRHTCDNGRCINPDHLIIGSIADNNRDMLERGRQVRGVSHGCSKLSPGQVKEIQSRYKARDPVNGGAALAREFGVHQTQVSKIILGHRW